MACTAHRRRDGASPAPLVTTGASDSNRALPAGTTAEAPPAWATYQNQLGADTALLKNHLGCGTAYDCGEHHARNVTWRTRRAGPIAAQPAAPVPAAGGLCCGAAAHPDARHAVPADAERGHHRQ